MRTTVAAAALLALAACTPRPIGTAGAACAAPLTPALQVDLYFGLVSGGRTISETEWAAFLADEVTPRFPSGLSVLDVAGQYHDPQGRVTRESSKLLILVVPAASTHLPQVKAIVDAYKSLFNQRSVLHVERSICAAF